MRLQARFRLLPLCAALCVTTAVIASADADPAWEQLNSAYNHLNSHQFDAAIAAFRRAAVLAPDRLDIRKNLAYTLLKTGDTEAARDEFAEAVRLAPNDQHLAREYAFLCFETREEAEALRVFRRLKALGDPVATEVFSRLDQELADGIERWSRAVELAPSSYSAHEELARLAERRGNNELAAKHYEGAWKLRPGERRYLLDLGRVWQQQGEETRARAALLAASRGAEPHAAERARGLLNTTRYPWVSEFRDALELDPENHALHRELAYLLLEMNRSAEAEAEFREVVRRDEKDAWSLAQLGFLLLARNQPEEGMPLLDRALASGDEDLRDRVRMALKLPRELRPRPEAGSRRDLVAEARLLAGKSYDAGYFRDAARYLRQVHENDPLDFETLLKLGWTYNQLHEDREAMEWFRLARRSPDAAIAAEAGKAFENLRPQFAKVRNSVWMYPMFSTRWQDLFMWSQYRTEFRPAARLIPYISTRFSGDARRRGSLNDSMAVSMLSESAVIPAVGLSTRTTHGMRAWVEAGYAFSYLRPDNSVPRIRPDLRGGVSIARHFGHSLASPENQQGMFAESTADLLYISRFDRDTLLYGQSRGGYTLRATGPVRLQMVWNLNLTTDLRRFAWANTFESGPGLRFRLTSLTQPVIFSVDSLNGQYLRPDGSRPAKYTDLRLGVWYAISH